MPAKKRDGDEPPPTVLLGADGFTRTEPVAAPELVELLAAEGGAPPAPPPRPGLNWTAGGRPLDGRYELVGRIGEGGMGTVYLAEDLLLQRRVAVKTLWAEGSFGDEEVARFRQEVALAHAVSHPNVARTYDLGETDGVSFLTMEFLEGETLAARLRRGAPLAASEIRALAVPLCRGLAAAHQAGIVHRDLKPANILLVPAPRRVVILDFGIAGWAAGAREAAAEAAPRGIRAGSGRHVTSAGYGTPVYMAPEQWRRAPGDPRTDIYALGVILFYCLTGRPPYDSESLEELERLHREEPVPDPRRIAPNADAGLCRLVRRCLEKSPSDRPQSVEEILEWLEMPARRRRFAWRLAWMGTAAALLLAGFGWIVLGVAENAILREMRPSLRSLAELLARDLDPADLDRLRAPADAGTEAFHAVAAAINARMLAFGEPLDAYVLRPGEAPGHYFFVFDPQPEDIDLDGDGVFSAGTDEEGFPPGKPYDGTAFPWMARALESGQPVAEPDFTMDQGRYVLTGYATVPTAGPEGPYLVGVDAPHDRLTALARNVRVALGAVWLAVLAALAAIFQPRRQLRRSWARWARRP